MDRGATCFSAWLRDEGLGLGTDGAQRRPNLSLAAQRYLDRLELGVEDLFHHVLAVLHDPAYREANAGALRMEWPRIPLPGWPDGDSPGAAAELSASAARGREVARLLEPETPVPGVTVGDLRPEMAAIAVPTTTAGRNMAEDDFGLTRRLGPLRHRRRRDAGPRPHRRAPLQCRRTRCPRRRSGNFSVIPPSMSILNSSAYWRNVPNAVWNYKLGGYQVLKKWLSYRASGVLDRPLLPEEVQHFTNTARRIGAILLVTVGPTQLL